MSTSTSNSTRDRKVTNDGIPIIATYKFAHEIVIEDFGIYYEKFNPTPKLDANPVTDSISFGPPNNSAIQFSLRIFPRGITKEAADDHVSIFVVQCGTQPTYSTFRIAILGPERRVKKLEESQECLFKENQCAWGWPQFCTQAFLERNLDDTGSLTICIEFDCHVTCQFDSEVDSTTLEESSKVVV